MIVYDDADRKSFLKPSSNFVATYLRITTSQSLQKRHSMSSHPENTRNPPLMTSPRVLMTHRMSRTASNFRPKLIINSDESEFLFSSSCCIIAPPDGVQSDGKQRNLIGFQVQQELRSVKQSQSSLCASTCTNTCTSNSLQFIISFFIICKAPLFWLNVMSEGNPHSIRFSRKGNRAWRVSSARGELRRLWLRGKSKCRAVLTRNDIIEC